MGLESLVDDAIQRRLRLLEAMTAVMLVRRRGRAWELLRLLLLLLLLLIELGIAIEVLEMLVVGEWLVVNLLSNA